jgi:hypothetical protein
MSSLQESERKAAAVAKAPRVALSDIEAEIVDTIYITGTDATRFVEHPLSVKGIASLATVTLCVATMRSGFVVVGMSAAASPENFNPDLGREFALNDVKRQLWQLMGFALKKKLSDEADARAAALMRDEHPDDQRQPAASA